MGLRLSICVNRCSAPSTVECRQRLAKRTGSVTITSTDLVDLVQMCELRAGVEGGSDSRSVSSVIAYSVIVKAVSNCRQVVFRKTADVEEHVIRALSSREVTYAGVVLEDLIGEATLYSSALQPNKAAIAAFCKDLLRGAAMRIWSR